MRADREAPVPVPRAGDQGERELRAGLRRAVGSAALRAVWWLACLARVSRSGSTRWKSYGRRKGRKPSRSSAEPGADRGRRCGVSFRRCTAGVGGTSAVRVAGATSDGAMHDVVAYVVGTIGWSWCGWCRQWRSHRSAGRLPEVRPSGCGESRNPSCPTKGDVPVMVWPVPVRSVARSSGDGRLGGKLPVSDERSQRFVTVLGAPHGVMPVPSAAVKLLRATPSGCTSRVQSARFTWVEKTGRIADVTLIRHDCKSGKVLRICYVDGKFESCYSNRNERIAGNKVRRAIIECEADA